MSHVSVKFVVGQLSLKVHPSSSQLSLLTGSCEHALTSPKEIKQTPVPEMIPPLLEDERDGLALPPPLEDERGRLALPPPLEDERGRLAFSSSLPEVQEMANAKASKRLATSAILLSLFLIVFSYLKGEMII
jgi:hypothetical protein